MSLNTLVVLLEASMLSATSVRYGSAGINILHGELGEVADLGGELALLL